MNKHSKTIQKYPKNKKTLTFMTSFILSLLRERKTRIKKKVV